MSMDAGALLSRIAALEAQVAALERERDAQQKLRSDHADERSLLLALIENVPGYIYAKDRQSRFLLANRPALRLLGAASLEEVIGKTDRDFFPEEMAAQFFADEQLLMDSGQALINHEERVIDQATGEARWNLSTKVPFRDGQGRIVGLVGLNWDITELRKATEGAQRAAVQEERLRAQAGLLDALSTPLLAISDRVLLMPLIGAVNPERAQKIVRVLSEGVAQRRAAHVILDLSGAELVEAQDAGLLFQVSAIVRLLGAELIVSGIGPEMAQSFVGVLGGSAELRTYGSLQGAIRATLRR